MAVPPPALLLRLALRRFLDLFDEKAPEPTAIQMAMIQAPMQQHGARAPMMIPTTAPPDIPAKSGIECVHSLINLHGDM
jgi:hypothetical protein